MLKECLDSVREKSPLIHCITNYVTVNDVANSLLAIGASPVMADEKKEVSEIIAKSSALCLNIGTLNQRTIKSMLVAGKKAKKLKLKIVLDPVGAGASTLRTKSALTIIKKLKPDVIRGNISEIRTLSGKGRSGKGVDAEITDIVTEENLLESSNFAKNFAEKNNCIVAITGKIDLVSDGKRCFAIRNGCDAMGKVTGTGCILTGLTTAFVASNFNQIESVVASVCTMGVAGEKAKRLLTESEGNATLRDRIIDALFCMTGDELEKYAKYEEI